MNSELLVKTLSECAALLRRSGDDFWSAKMEQVAARGSGSSFYGEKEVLGWFGGMGSLNDVLLSNVNGYTVSDAEEDAVNAEFRRLTSIIYQQAKQLARE